MTLIEKMANCRWKVSRNVFLGILTKSMPSFNNLAFIRKISVPHLKFPTQLDDDEVDQANGVEEVELGRLILPENGLNVEEGQGQNQDGDGDAEPGDLAEDVDKDPEVDLHRALLLGHDAREVALVDRPRVVDIWKQKSLTLCRTNPYKYVRQCRQLLG